MKQFRRTMPLAFPDVRGRVTLCRQGRLRTPPALSVIMPCFGDAEFTLVHTALTSVLSQEFTDFELIALTDSRRRLAPQLFGPGGPGDPRLLQLDVSGPAGLRAIAFGRALLRCRGGYVLLLPSAASLRGDALEEIRAAVYRRPQREFYYFGGPDLASEPVGYDLLLRDNPLQEAALLVPRECLSRVGLPDPHLALERHFLWDWTVRLLQHFASVPLTPTRPFIELFAPPRDEAAGEPDGSQFLERAVARRMMANNRTACLLPENWCARPVGRVDESVLLGLARDEKDHLERRAQRLGLSQADEAVPGSTPVPHRARPAAARSLRVTILATCHYLDTANVFVEQPLLEIVGNRPLHYRLIKAKDATEADIQDTDVLLLSRTLFEGWERALQLAVLQKERRRPVVFVMDDDLLDLPPDVVINEEIPVARRFERFLPHLDGMIVAAPYLQKRMQARFPGLPVHVLDNSCCVTHAPADRRKEPRVAGQVRVALTLTSSALLRVRAFADGLHRLPEDVREAVQLHVFGETAPVRDLLPLPHKVCHRYLPYLEYLALLEQLQLDLALVPLPGDHDFYHCKTAVKYYEFAGLGVPGIYSRVPIYESAVRHGENGWLVNNTSDEWSEAITLFVRDASLRQRLAGDARKDVVEHHTVRQRADEWWELLQQIVSPRISRAAA